MENTKHTILAAFRLIFRPIATILLRAGITWKEVAEIGKATYVAVAGAEFGIRGRPTNASRVAILTGFTRKEVSRLRGLLAAENSQLIDKMNHATRVLSGWYTDKDYLSDAGVPAAIPVSGAAVSFESLCNRYASDVPATTMLKELMHVGAVAEHGSGQVIAKTRYYMPVQMDAEQILSSGSVLQDLGNTVAHNLYRKSDKAARFERRASNTRVSADAAPEFQEFLESEGQAFLERVDEWLSEHEIDENSNEEGIRLGLGAYWIEQ
ncbi:MAG: DUF6502 family protein [Gammaproteobacteria bacterium]|nr:DUF6502 family protein [Gammaproteobacteria bacterium]